MCARQGALTRRCKSSTDPARGTVSRTARVSIARRNLKEAAGKALARRTETAYEASVPGEESRVSKAQYLSGRRGRICGGYISSAKAAQVAANARRWWRNSALALHLALPNSYFDGLGVPRLAS